MTRNPIVNGLAAVLYITILVTFLTFGEKFFPEADGIIIPIAFLSLFVFSAASMGYIFLYQPLQMFFEGEKKAATTLFLQTLVSFAVSAFVLVVVGLYLRTLL